MRTRRTIFLSCAIIVTALIAVFETQIPCFFSKGNLHCFKNKDPWFRSHYDPTIKLFLTSDDAIFQNLLGALPEREWQTLLARTIETLAGNSQATLSSRSIAHIRCAVVGNSANLIGSNYGTHINEHDIVFRMNNAPTQGYEKDVGSKTSVHVVHNWIRIIFDRDAHTLTVINFHPPEYSNSEAVMWALKSIIAQTFESAPQSFRPPRNFLFTQNIGKFKGRLQLTSPTFMRYVRTRWFKPDMQPEEKIPSTGFHTLIMALHLCDEVNLFGFSSPDEKNKWNHYFEQVKKPVPKRHLADLQWETIKELHARGIIGLYLGNTKNSTNY